MNIDVEFGGDRIFAFEALKEVEGGVRQVVEDQLGFFLGDGSQLFGEGLGTFVGGEESAFGHGDG